MNTPDLVGQSLMLSIRGTTLSAETAALLARTRAGGVILFAANISGPAQLRALCAALQTRAAALGLPPLLIAIDQEGGVVSRLPAPFVTVPGQLAQAASGDPEVAYAAARISAVQLRAHGINVNFAPVLDVNCNPANPVIGIRAFGADPDVVTRFGLAALRGYAEAGVVAVVKHFPGHGDTTVDSHMGLPSVAHDRARLERVELAPFRAAIAAGAPALMTAHMIFSALDDRPATLAPPILRGLLRAELGFDGVIFTDALDMQAIADRYGAPAAAVLAKAAGADIALPLGDAATQIAVADALAAALADGRLSRADFADTARRLAALRTQYGIGADAPERAASDWQSHGHAAAPDVLGRSPAFGDAAGVGAGRRATEGPLATTEAAQAAGGALDLDALEREALELARRSLGVRDPALRLPLAPTTRLAVIDCLQPRFNNAEDAVSRAELLRGLLLDRFAGARYLALLPDAPAAAWAEALDLARGAELLLLVTRNAWASERQARLAGDLAATSLPLIHLAARAPRDAELLPGAAVTLLTYGDPPLALQAAVAALSGPV